MVPPAERNSNVAPLLLCAIRWPNGNDGVALQLAQQRHSIVAVRCPL